MTPEGQKPSENKAITTLAIIAGVYFVSQLAFSMGTKRKIWERDGGQSVLSGATDDLEVAHIDHSRDNPKYDHESNGRLLTTAEHLKDHINRAGRNGLTKQHNNWAIERLKERLGIE